MAYSTPQVYSEPPVFVIGNPRSGTTLLRLMLTCHPKVVVPPEGAFMIHLYRKYRNYSGALNEIPAFVKEVLTASKMEFWGLDQVELITYLEARNPRTYADLVDGVYRYYAEKNNPDGHFWGDKNNFHLDHIPTIARLFPDARFVHIVRDGRDVACSYRDLYGVRGPYAPDLPNSVQAVASQWRRNLHRIHADLCRISPQQVHELRYEDLVAEPQLTLERVCNTLGIEFADDMLAYAEKNREKNLEPEAFDAWKSLARESLTASQVNRWRREMFAEDLHLFERIAGKELAQYCYELSGGTSLTGIRQYRLRIFFSPLRHALRRLLKR